MTFSCSMIDPGQPWVMITGSALGCFDFTWMKWMSSPSMLVMKLRIGEDLRLGAAPIVMVRPIIGELLHRREPDALRVVVDRLAVGPFGRLDAALEVGEFLVGRMIFERTDRGVAALLSGGSDDRRISAGSGGGGRRRSRLADRRARAGRNRRGAHRRQGKKRSDRSDCGSGQEMAAADHEAWSVHARSPALEEGAERLCSTVEECGCWLRAARRRLCAVGSSRSTALI